MGSEDLLLLLLIKNCYKCLALEGKNCWCFPAGCGHSEFHVDARERKGGRTAKDSPFCSPRQQWVHQDKPRRGAEGDGSPTGHGANEHLAVKLCHCVTDSFFCAGNSSLPSRFPNSLL